MTVTPPPPSTEASALPATRCPLCGGDNACAPAASGSLATACWCRSASFPPELLARVPQALRGKACICAKCAAAAARNA